MHTAPPKFALLLLAFCCGCNGGYNSASQTSTDNHVAAQTETLQFDATPDKYTVPKIEPGFYGDGDDYERVSSVLAGSDATVMLDYHSGIEWYDKTSKTRSKLNDINDVKSLLAQIENRRVVTVSTGKAVWDKYDEYIGRVAGFADELGFDITIATNDNTQGLVISKVIQHKH